ncbi:MAG: acyl-CoA dehydrogenase [Actinophytocola sp.]|nr:acyl-CoA dehydrogenase [Actinophytocola sp.]
MRFTLSPEQRDFAASINDLLADADTPAVIHAWTRGKPESGLRLWRQLADLGVMGLAVPEEHSGLGASAVDLTVAVEVLGRHAVPGPVVESIAALPVLLADSGDARWLPGLASGESVGTLAWPPHVPYAVDADVADVRLCVSEGMLREFVPVDSLSSVDASRRLSAVDFGSVIGPAQTRCAWSYGVLACAAQSLGAGRRLLDMSVDYAKQRSQYGNPIGGYQAVKHLLADAVTQLELARPLLYGAAISLDAGSDTAVRDVSAARVACADAAYLAARTALQVHGAIGYTAEHDLSLWLTKVRALQSAWGTQAWHRGQVLAALMAERRAA